MNIEFLEQIYLRGLEGMIADTYLKILVNNEWKDAFQADEAMKNQFEAKYIAEQFYAQMKGW